MKNFLRNATLALSFTLLTGCSPLHFLLSKIHVVDIQQGNRVSKKELEKIQIGMPKTLVREILGDPILVTSFDDYRWDYVYSIQKGMHARKQRTITILFDRADRVKKIEKSPWITP